MSTGAWATDQDSGGNWQYGASIYLRGAGINGETAAGSEVDVSFSDLIIYLNRAFMGAFEARRAQWSSLTDVIVLNVGADGGGGVSVYAAPGPDISVKVEADVKAKDWVLNLFGGYNLRQNELGSPNLIAGAPCLHIELDYGLGLGTGPFARSRDISVSGSVW